MKHKTGRNIYTGDIRPGGGIGQVRVQLASGFGQFIDRRLPLKYVGWRNRWPVGQGGNGREWTGGPEQPLLPGESLLQLKSVRFNHSRNWLD